MKFGDSGEWFNGLNLAGEVSWIESWLYSPLKQLSIDPRAL